MTNDIATEEYAGDKDAAKSRAADAGDIETTQEIADSVPQSDIATSVALGGIATPATEDRAAEQMEGDGPR